MSIKSKNIQRISWIMAIVYIVTSIHFIIILKLSNVVNKMEVIDNSFPMFVSFFTWLWLQMKYQENVFQNIRFIFLVTTFAFIGITLFILTVMH